MASVLIVETTLCPPCSATLERTAPLVPSFGLLRASLIATLLAAPLAFGAVQAWSWGGEAVAAFLLLLLWAIAGARQGRVKILWSPLYLPAALFFLVGVIQFAGLLTMDPMATREALLKLSTDLIFFFLAGQLFCSLASARDYLDNGTWGASISPLARRRSDILSASPLRWTLVAYTFLLALFAILQFFSSQGLIYWMVKSPGWTFGPYVNHNHYAGLMEMLIPLSMASALPGLRKHPSAVVVSCVILIPVVSLLLSGSRGGLISILVEILLAAVLVFCCGPRHMRKVTALAGGVSIFAAALLFFWMAPGLIAERMATMADSTHPSDVALRMRLVAARDSLGIFRDHPWLGSGLGSFETAFPRYQSFPSDFDWDHAHNDYAEALAETGLAGGAAILTALGMFFWLAFRNLRERLRRPAGWMQFAAALGCCGMLVHSFADFNLHIPANAAWFAVCVAIATSPSRRVVGSSLRLNEGRLLPFGLKHVLSNDSRRDRSNFRFF
jgi:O-antigen ligase